MARKLRSSLFAAGERLDRVVREVKENQFHLTGVCEIPVVEPTELHPEEAWAKRFGAHVIRPIREQGDRPPLSGFVAPLADMPRMPLFLEPAPATLDEAPASGHIGSGLGKPGPRRSWLGRMFGRRGI